MDPSRDVWRHVLRHLDRIPAPSLHIGQRQAVPLGMACPYHHERHHRTVAGTLHQPHPQWRVARFSCQLHGCHNGCYCWTCRVFLSIGQKALREAKNGGSSQSMHWLERKHDLARAKSSNHSRPKFPIHTFVSIQY